MLFLTIAVILVGSVIAIPFTVTLLLLRDTLGVGSTAAKLAKLAIWNGQR